MISGGHVNAIWFLKSSFVRLRDDDDSGGDAGKVVEMMITKVVVVVIAMMNGKEVEEKNQE